jgi:sugar phosphate isomerase/epimerase
MKQYSTRRDFIKTSGLAGIVLATTSFDFKKYNPLLSFSTLGCPDWTFDQILDFASANHYDGIEWRGLQRQMDLTKCKEFSKENISSTLKRLKEKNLKVVNLGSSAVMHLPEGLERSKSLGEAKQFITLAHQLNCPFVRVFPNIFPKDQDKNQTMKLMSGGLNELGAFAKNTGVTVLMETHGELVHVDDLLKVMSMVNQRNVGLVWDVVNMFSITKEPVDEVYPRLKKYIHHTHIKDAKFVDGGLKYVLLGTGDMPIAQAVTLLAKDGYKGYYSFEWEKLWHPEIDAPEIALADYPKAMKKILDR